jgi:CspA family cold shock protein
MMAIGKIERFFADKGFGFIIGEDRKKYFVHISKVQGGVAPVEGEEVSFDGKQGQKGLEAHNVRVPAREQSAAAGRVAPGTRNPDTHDAGSEFAYGFVRRKPGKAAPEAFHHRQEQDRLDVAFDITWITETPTALQPCEDVSVPPSAVGRDGENIGYNKRWLMIDGKPAISPFTVKGAIANGVANLLGGCYRVPDREEGHNESNDPSTFPYTGKWKRYRVSMNSKSLPCIIQEIDATTGYVKVQPAVEYYLDDANIPEWLKSGMPCQASWSHPVNKKGKTDRNKRILEPGSIEPHAPGTAPKKGRTALVYYNRYFFGMNLTLKPGEYRKRHHHRFYESKEGSAIDGTVPDLSFATLEELKKKVYTGNFSKNDRGLLAQNADLREHLLGTSWYENLRDLKPGDWCYYTAFSDADGQQKIASIGKNFQFKALFNHKKALPSGNETCTDPSSLCPRCSLFGLADKSDGNDKEAVGYAGRFRAATLVSSITVAELKIPDSIPAKETLTPQKVQMAAWCIDDRQVIRQFALPIMGPPKPSKRDVNGYFDEKTGTVKGAKRYRHAEIDFERSLPALIKKTDGHITTDEGMPYAHQMRPIAAVCREGVTFTGTVGAENCSAQEIAALLALLDRRAADHAFKLGLGKNIGLGSVTSMIGKVWVRRPGAAWQQVEVPDTENSRKELFAALKEVLPEAVEELKRLINDKESATRLHSMKERANGLRFAKAGLGYWKEAQVETV